MNRKKRILIVDDSNDIQSLLTLLLQSKGYTVDCCAEGEEALNFLNMSVFLPDVILLDMNMPVMDGAAFLKFQASTPSLRDIPTIVISGDDGMDITLENVEVLTKPLSMEAVLASVKRLTSPVERLTATRVGRRG